MGERVREGVNEWERKVEIVYFNETETASMPVP